MSDSKSTMVGTQSHRISSICVIQVENIKYIRRSRIVVEHLQYFVSARTTCVGKSVKVLRSARRF